MIESPTGRSVSDNEHALPFPAKAQVGQKSSNTINCLSPALAARVWYVEILSAVPVQIDRWLSVQAAIIALAESPVGEDRHRCLCESNSGRFDSASKIRGKDGLDAIVTSARTELAGKDSATC